MRKTLLATAMAVLMGMSACAPIHHARPHHQKAVKVVHTSDGRYAYQDNNMIWWWYYIASTNNTTYSGSSAASGGSASVFPAGGSWVKGDPPTANQMAGAEENEVELDVMAEGEPAVEAPSEAAAEAGQSTDVATEGGGAASDGGGAASSSSDGGSSGGGDGGGGGGGDGGD